MAQRWEADRTAGFGRRLGKSAAELGLSDNNPSCPDVWELDNGDVVVIGRDLTDDYATRLPEGVSVGADERLVVIPRATILAAKDDLV
ncbi:hypothetical protein [Actinokineospora globicatena]|uniref:Uncharacterized protein n=1 Tax=Actinokineospora globicatena TaxID=103729 RepID=A0A9W6QPT2_9PSEU|nr:hypothetical protein [Actinokineospora globicatena]MCP2305864.1 hypothetical protein [Actinokineospora globicatena]GLW80267.1 hypothetical protein Aglo01_47480 [Actinokineospora globicatena]GLW87096.1 hypothetical protein Aglo02_47350 [Actinokineospora globicatena]GLW93462.1 hypothetical protein Aglo03_42780 [Actinokineospora globicatena]